MRKNDSNQNLNPSPDNRGIEKEDKKKLNDLAAEVNRDIGRLKEKPVKKNKEK